MRDQRFAFLCTPEERICLEKIAARHKRSKGDTIRLLILKAAEELGIDKRGDEKNNSTIIQSENANGSSSS